MNTLLLDARAQIDPGWTDADIVAIGDDVLRFQVDPGWKAQLDPGWQTAA